MNLLAIFHPKRHAVVRYVAATKNENTAAARRKVETSLLLAVYAATTSLEQRKVETAEFFSMRQRERAKQGHGA